MNFAARLSALFAISIAVARGGVVWQPVTDYSISFPGDRPDAAPAINHFENFTHLGSDFGWMGPGRERIDAKAGAIRTKTNGEWTGAWHSLAGLAGETERRFDPTDVTGLGGPAEARAKIVALTVDARGEGRLKVELADAGKMVRFSRELELHPGERTRHRFAVTAEELGPLKFFNWVVEGGSAIEVSAIGFEVETPEMPAEEWMFRVSLGKLRRCHDPSGGLTRDRAHTRSGTFDSVTSSGLHALATAAAAAEGILERPQAEEEVRRTTMAVLSLPRAAGWLPHFSRRDGNGAAGIHPGTEYSTVDTAIALHALRLAGSVLGLDDVRAAVESAVAELDFDVLTDADGWIGHGFTDDANTPLASRWKDWGGETALVLALEAMVPGREPRGRMETGGRVFRDCAFIAEIQSLFYPDFDRAEPDLVSGVNWPEARRGVLLRQISYVPDRWPGSPAAEAGIFGLSGGEAGMPGAGYTASGPELPGLRWLHLHAMVMGSALSGRDRHAADLARLADAGLLFPQGLPENVEIGLVLHNPMQGSLNAGFEALASYHGWRRGRADLIDRAALSDPLLRRGAARFYPPRTSP